MHHTICDGWSMYVLYGEIGRAYDAYLAGTEPALPPLPIQYSDFSAWQRHYMASGVLRKQLNFWQVRALPHMSWSSCCSASYRNGVLQSWLDSSSYHMQCIAPPCQLYSKNRSKCSFK